MKYTRDFGNYGGMTYYTIGGCPSCGSKNCMGMQCKMSTPTFNPFSPLTASNDGMPQLPQGYKLPPADYVGDVYLRSQMKAYAYGYGEKLRRENDELNVKISALLHDVAVVQTKLTLANKKLDNVAKSLTTSTVIWK